MEAGIDGFQNDACCRWALTRQWRAIFRTDYKSNTTNWLLSLLTAMKTVAITLALLGLVVGQNLAIQPSYET